MNISELYSIIYQQQANNYVVSEREIPKRRGYKELAMKMPIKSGARLFENQ